MRTRKPYWTIRHFDRQRVRRYSLWSRGVLLAQWVVPYDDLFAVTHPPIKVDGRLWDCGIYRDRPYVEPVTLA